MLSAAMSARVELHARFVMQPLNYMRSQIGRSRSDFAWEQLRRKHGLKATVVPGLRRFSRVSAWLLRRTYQRMCARYGQPDVVVVDTPYLLELMEAVEGPARVYLANDVYRFFAWDRDETDRRERTLIQLADLTFAVAPLIVEDFRTLGAHPVELLPTAVSDEFVGAFRTGPRGSGNALPADLVNLPAPRILCVGNINDTYDWALIEELMRERPEASLALIGPIHQELSADGRRVLAMPNVHWLGPRSHSELPSYIAAADVLLNPLEPGEHSDRRFPLRLTEYMASDRPILSTEIEPARYFANEVHTVRDGQEAAQTVDAMLAGTICVDVDARKSWLASNTWDARANQFVEFLHRHEVLKAPR
jgi:glycosyltransferase involved in cell wall biosynthesis